MHARWPKLIVIALALLAMSEHRAIAAKIESSSDSSISIDGAIVPGDEKLFRKVSESVDKADNPKLYLNSLGGDVITAMDIGRQVRAMSIRTHVSYRCVSACVFILAGGVERSLYNRLDTQLGIHRPFPTDTGTKSLGDADKAYKQMESLVRAYFAEMNIAPELVTEMLRIPPNKVRLLNRAEAERFGLVGTDPAFLDIRVSKWAVGFHTTKAELYNRMALSERNCRFGDGSKEADRAETDCHIATMRGLSVAEYKLRERRIEQECPKSDGTDKTSKVIDVCEAAIWTGR